MSKPFKITLIILGSLIALLLLFTIIPFVIRAYDEKNGVDPTKKPLPPYYSKYTLEEIIGVELRESESDLFGQKCTRIWNNQNTPTEFDDLRFYIFENKRTAKKAFKKLKRGKNTIFLDITGEGKNYISGWLANVYDADVESYYYITKNMIITTTLTCVDESARTIDDPTDPVFGGGEYAEKLIELITSNFR